MAAATAEAASAAAAAAAARHAMASELAVAPLVGLAPGHELAADELLGEVLEEGTMGAAHPCLPADEAEVVEVCRVVEGRAY
jgi:hypothetical protein